LTYLYPLDKETLLSILTEPKNSLIKQYVTLFRYEDIDLAFDKDAYGFIVDKAWEINLGARGLRSHCEAIMLEARLEITTSTEFVDTKALHITLDYAKQKFAKSDMKKLHVA